MREEFPALKIVFGPDQPTRFIAEISNNHNGSLERAIRLIDAAKRAGCDGVKFQCYTPDELVALRGNGPAPEPWGSQGWDMRALYTKARTPLEWFPRLFTHTRQIGIPAFTSVFGPESLEMAKNCGNGVFKIARLDNKHRWLVDACRAASPGRGSIMVSSSKEDGPMGDIALYCPPGYPQVDLGLDSDAKLFRATNTIRGFDGFSYHGTQPSVLILAATLGAMLIEFHLQLDDEPSELESEVSLTVSQATDAIHAIRCMEAILT